LSWGWVLADSLTEWNNGWGAEFYAPGYKFTGTITGTFVFEEVVTQASTGGKATLVRASDGYIYVSRPDVDFSKVTTHTLTGAGGATISAISAADAYLSTQGPKIKGAKIQECTSGGLKLGGSVKNSLLSNSEFKPDGPGGWGIQTEGNGTIVNGCRVDALANGVGGIKVIGASSCCITGNEFSSPTTENTVAATANNGTAVLDIGASDMADFAVGTCVVVSARFSYSTSVPASSDPTGVRIFEVTEVDTDNNQITIAEQYDGGGNRLVTRNATSDGALTLTFVTKGVYLDNGSTLNTVCGNTFSLVGDYSLDVQDEHGLNMIDSNAGYNTSCQEKVDIACLTATLEATTGNAAADEIQVDLDLVWSPLRRGNPGGTAASSNGPEDGISIIITPATEAMAAADYWVEEIAGSATGLTVRIKFAANLVDATDYNFYITAKYNQRSVGASKS